MKHKTAKKRTKTSGIYVMNNKLASAWQAKIKEAMKQRKLSQRKLAEKAGLGATSIRHAVTKAETISIESLRRIADAVDLPLTYFMTGNTFLFNDLSDTSKDVTHMVYVLPIHGPTDEPGEDHGLGFVTVPEKDAGTAPYALRMGDNSMMGTGSNAPVDPLMVIGPSDVAIYDANKKASVGQWIVVNIAPEGGGPHWAVRVLERDGDEYYAAALSRSFGRQKIELEKILGGVTTVVRFAA